MNYFVIELNVTNVGLICTSDQEAKKIIGIISLILISEKTIDLAFIKAKSKLEKRLISTHPEIKDPVFNMLSYRQINFKVFIWNRFLNFSFLKKNQSIPHCNFIYYSK